MGDMLKAIAICPDEELADSLTELLGDGGSLRLTRVIRKYPEREELGSILRASAPSVVFISGEKAVRTGEVAANISRDVLNVRIVALVRRADSAVSTSHLSAAGVHEFLYYPFDQQQLTEVVRRMEECLQRTPAAMKSTDLVFSFLPSKPGAGASTVVANLAVAAGRLREERSLLMDCDRGNGIVRFLLQIEKGLALPDLARNAFHLDEVIWRQVVTSIDNMDVIHSGAMDSEQRVESVHIQRILEFAQRNYNSVFVDLSGAFESFSIAAMEASRQIFVVVTPELASAHMAREKIRYLKRLNLEDRTAIVLNRAQKKSLLSREQIEDVLQLPVAASFTNDYHRVNAALTAGKAIEANSELGMQLETFAGALLDRKQSSGEAKRLTDYFTLTAAKSLFRVVEVMRAEGELR